MVTSTEITISWAPPISCLSYGGVLVAYTIQYHTDAVTFFNEQDTTANGDVTQHTLTSLTPGTLYHIRVAPSNRIGVGAFSAVSMATTLPASGMCV